MSRKMELNELNELFECGHDFELTDIEYKKYVGKEMPKTDRYIKTNSPIARKAKEYGYEIQVEERVVKVIEFKKMKQIQSQFIGLARNN